MVAKLRTLTGCLHCRRRRKKCDENKPTCQGCRRNGLHCQWQASDHVDRRRLRHNHHDEKKAVHKTRPSPARHQLVHVKEERCNKMTVPAIISFYQHAIDERGSYLVDYCLFCFLPSQYHQGADGKPTIDLSYLRYMCLESHLLFNAVSACALVTSERQILECPRESAHRSYMNAIHAISTGIAQGTITGTEDHLLATVLWLCVYENSQIHAKRQTSIHAGALRQILLLREPMDRSSASTSELVWERMCVESYIYHSAVMTLFDSQLNLIEDTVEVLNKFESHMSYELPLASPNPNNYWIPLEEAADTPEQCIIKSPVLGAPYHMFLFLMEGIRLVRTACLAGFFTDDILAWSRYYEVHKMQFTLESSYACYSDSRRWIGKLYAVAIRLLFLYVISASGYNNDMDGSHIGSVWSIEMDSTLNEARSLLITTEDDIDRTCGKFFLWPLAIIGAMVGDKSDIDLVRSWLDRVISKSSNSSPIIIRKVLEDQIWNDRHSTNSPDNNNTPGYTRGLSVMFDTGVMNDAATSFINQKRAIAYEVYDDMPN